MAQSVEWECAQKEALLRTPAGAPRWVDQSEMSLRTIKRATAGVPKAFRVEACITVEVLVGKSGAVKCARSTQGHPLLRVAAIKAARGSTFQPWVEEGRVMAYLGRVDIPFSSSGGNPCAGKTKGPH